MPAYIVYIGIVGLALSFTSSRLLPSEWLRAATYTVSLFREPSWYIGHAWSLSVEEHFYLVWPALFLLLSKRVLFCFCVGYSLVAIVLRGLLHRMTFIHAEPTLFSPIRLDAIAAGCALALFATSRFRHMIAFDKLAAAMSALAALLVLLIASLFHNNMGHIGVLFYTLGFRFTVEWCIVVIVWASVLHPKSAVGRLLNWRPLTAIGVLSYSIYLWQQPFMGPIQPNWMFKMPGNFLVIAILASASYFFVEQPFLRLKPRFERTREAKERSTIEAEPFILHGAPIPEM
jgi:peptidoglycan/LPS O-acetylase OafA/YrhL